MMWKKTVYLLIALTAAYAYVMVNYPSDILKSVGYNSVLNMYGSYFASRIDYQVLYNPGLRKLDLALENPKIKAVAPHTDSNYPEEVQRFLSSGAQVIVECSGLDTWHSTDEGKPFLGKIRSQGYRVVIFDGGHHLSTLGLAPDIIIVPEFRGYTAHGYTRDGMKIETLRDILQASQSKIIMVAVPRWKLVKTEGSLAAVTSDIIRNLPINNNPQIPFEAKCKPRISKYNGKMYIYINEEYALNSSRLISNCQALGLEDVNMVYMAFDYNIISALQADNYINTIKPKLGKEVKRVNEPVKVSDLFLRLK